MGANNGEASVCVNIKGTKNEAPKDDKTLWETVKPLIKDEKKRLEEVRTEKDGTILHLAVEFGDNDYLEHLLKHEPFKTMVDRPNIEGETPFHSAVIVKNKRALEILLQHGADPNARDLRKKAPLDHVEPDFSLKWEGVVAYAQKIPTFVDLEKNQEVCDNGTEASLRESSGEENPNSQVNKMRRRAEIYNLLDRRSYKALLEKLRPSTDMRVEDVDFYVGDKKLICHVLYDTKGELLDRMNVVNVLLDIGVNPLSCNYRGNDSAVEFALRKKQSDLLKRMIGILKGKIKEDNDISFHLLRRTFMMAGDEGDHQERENETMKWLELLFEIDAIKNVDQTNPGHRSALDLGPNPGHFIERSALDEALSYDFERAVVFLLKHGATVNSDNRDDVLDALTPETLTELLNAAVTFGTDEFEKESKNATKESENQDPSFMLTAILNYGQFIANATKDKTEDTIETDLFMSICQKKQFQDALSHPLVWALIMAKWSKLWKSNKVYSLLASVWHFVLIGSFTALVWPSSTDKTGSLEIIDERRILKWVVVALCSLNIVVDIGKFYLSLKLQWSLRSKPLICFSIAISALIKFFIVAICLWIRSRSVIAWAVPAAWINSVISVGLYWKRLNTITTMLLKITLHVGKLSVLALLLVAGFSLSFSILFWPNQYTNNNTSLADFSSPLTAFPRVVAMATGEFGYDSLRDGLLVKEHTLTSVFSILLFLVFVFLVFMVIMNVMTGVAMVDAQEIKDSAAQNYLMRQLEVAYVIEQLPKRMSMLAKLTEKWPICKIWPKTQLLSEKPPILKFPSKGKVIQNSSGSEFTLPSDQAKELRQKLLTLREEKVAQKEKKEAKMEKEEQRRNMQKLLSRTPVDEGTCA